MKKITLTLAMFCAIVLSCKKETKIIIEEQLTGNIMGKVLQYNQFGQKLNSDLNKITISLDNDTVKGSTDEEGNYTLVGVKQGIYTITFSKPGCLSYQSQQITFPANGTLYQNATVVETPTFVFSSATAHLINPPERTFTLNIKLAPNDSSTSALLVFGNSPDIDINNHDEFTFTQSLKIEKNTGEKLFYITFAPVGATYVKLYPYAGQEITYFDYYSGRYIYSGFGTPLPAISLY